MFEDAVKSFYDDIYIGEPIDDDEFPRLQQRAEDALMAATFGRIHGCHPPHVKDAILRAWCAQIEWLYYNGVESAVCGASGGGFTVGHVSVSGSSGRAAAGSSGGLCKSAAMFLAPTGLLYCGGVMV